MSITDSFNHYLNTTGKCIYHLRSIFLFLKTEKIWTSFLMGRSNQFYKPLPEVEKMFFEICNTKTIKVVYE